MSLRHSRIFCVISTLSIFGQTLFAQQSTPETGGKLSLPILSQGYLANRESFRYLSCQFKVLDGEAKTVENARRGEFSSPPTILTGYWLVNGPKQRLNISCDPAIIDKVRKGDQSVYLSIVLVNWITDGRYQARTGSAAPIVNFYHPGSQVNPPEVDPFDFFGAKLDSDLNRCITDLPHNTRVTESVKWEGHAVTLVEHTEGGSRPVSESYYIDSSRGYLPIGVRVSSPSLSFYRYVDQVRAFPEHRWFPEKTIAIQHFLANGEVRVRILEVTSLDVSTPPPDSAFDLDLTNYMQVTDPARPSSVFAPRPGDKIDVSQMHLIAEKLDGQIDLRKREEARNRGGAGEPIKKKSPDQISISLLIGAIVLVFGIVWWRRSLRKHKPPTPPNFPVAGGEGVIPS